MSKIWVHFKLSHPVIARNEAIQYTTLTLDCFDNKLSRNDGKVVKRQFEMHPKNIIRILYGEPDSNGGGVAGRYAEQGGEKTIS